MKDEKKAPKLRFKGFTDDWEQCKLGDVASFTNGRAYKQDELLDKGKYRVLRVGNLYTNDSWYYSNMELDDKYYINKGDLIYTWSATFGPHIWDGERAIYHYHIWKVELSDYLDKKFATQLLEIDKTKLLSNTNGSTMVHITKNGMENKQVILPSITEQSCIGKLLRNLDQTITLHEEKKHQLERLKSALLQKMFADESGYPVVRFSNFGDKWKQYKLSDIGEIVTGSTPPRQHPEYYSDNGILWVTPTDITDNLISDTAKKLSVSGTRAAQVVPAGSILVTCIASIGKNALLLTEGSFNQQINCIVPNSNKFDSYYLLTESFQWVDPMRRIAGAGTMQIVNKHNFSEINTFIPELEEQIVIGNIFSKLDSLIALYKQKLEKINILKQCLLQKMFI